MSVLIHPADNDHTNRDTAAPDGPFARIIATSVAAGLVTALVLALLVFAAADEATIIGAILLAFALGWAMIGVLSTRFTNRPQRWAAVPALAMGVTGLGLLGFTPQNAAMTAMSWVWPAPVLALAVYIWLRIRRDLPGRGRWMLGPVVAVLAVAPLAATYENITVVHDQHAYTAPGTSYDVGGHRLYLDCRGHGSPTIVLDNGLGEVAASWSRIVSQVETTTRICAYDRAGQGWSQDVTSPQDGIAAARDLHTLLSVAGEHGPYLMVGHSIGGTFAMAYAAQYPEQVAGMVLLDSSSPEQLTAIPSYPAQYNVMHRVMALAPTLSRLGVGRLIAAMAPSHLPAPAAAQVAALTASAHGARNSSADWSVLPEVFKQAQALTTLGSRPLAVLTATESLQTGGWAAAQDQLVALSSNHTHRVVESSHLGLLEDQRPAAAAVNAIDDVIAAVRAASRLPSS
jgi:pimeloyl-ACP methyl ester carboxylesterase